MKIFTLLYCVFVSVCFTATSHAQEKHNLGVAFSIERNSIELEFAGSTRDTDIDTIQIHWYEHLLSHLDGHATLGYIDTSQSTNPISEGQNTTGEFLELGLRGYFYRGDIFSLSSGIIYRYSQTSHNQTNQDIEWRWHQGTLDLQGQLQVSAHIELMLGVSGTVIDGEERASGTINQIIDFGEKKALSGHVAAQIILDRTGRIGIKIDTGSLRGGRIYFSRWY